MFFIGLIQSAGLKGPISYHRMWHLNAECWVTVALLVVGLYQHLYLCPTFYICSLKPYQQSLQTQATHSWGWNLLRNGLYQSSHFRPSLLSTETSAQASTPAHQHLRARRHRLRRFRMELHIEEWWLETMGTRAVNSGRVPETTLPLSAPSCGAQYSQDNPDYSPIQGQAGQPATRRWPKVCVPSCPY